MTFYPPMLSEQCIDMSSDIIQPVNQLQSGLFLSGLKVQRHLLFIPIGPLAINCPVSVLTN